MMPQSHNDLQIRGIVHQQNAKRVEHKPSENTAPVISVSAEVHNEPSPQPGAVDHAFNRMQIGRRREQVLSDDAGVQRYGGHGANQLVKQRILVPTGFPRTTVAVNSGDEEPAAEFVAHSKDQVSKKNSGGPSQEQRNEDQRDNRVSKTDVHTNPVSDKDIVTDSVVENIPIVDVRTNIGHNKKALVAANVVENTPIVLLHSEAMDSRPTNEVAGVGAAEPTFDGNFEGGLDSARRKSADRSPYPMLSSLMSSISNGEVVADTHLSDGWSDLDTVAESIADMPAYGDAGRISDARRRECDDGSPASANRGIVVTTERSADLLDTDGESYVRNVAVSAVSKFEDQPATKPGICWPFYVLLIICLLIFSSFLGHLLSQNVDLALSKLSDIF